MSRAILALATASFAALLFAPQVAAHGIVERDGGVLRYTAPDPGIGAELTISSPLPGKVEFLDRTSPGGFDWGHCLPLSERRARCPLRGITRIEVEVYDGDDVVTARVSTPVVVEAGPGTDRVTGGYGGDDLDAGSGNDILVGGGGVDAFAGAEGDDVIRARDGAEEAIGCGAGSDMAEVDDRDDDSLLALLDCEVVDSSAAEPDRRDPAVRLFVNRPLRLAGSLRLRMTASMDEPGSLSVGGPIRFAGETAGQLIVGRARPSAPGQRWTLRPRIPHRLGPKVREKLDQGETVTAILVAKGEDRAGNAATRRLGVRLAP